MKEFSVRLTVFEPDNLLAATQNTAWFTVAPAETEIDLSLQLSAPKLLGDLTILMFIG